VTVQCRKPTGGATHSIASVGSVLQALLPLLHEIFRRYIHFSSAATSTPAAFTLDTLLFVAIPGNVGEYGTAEPLSAAGRSDGDTSRPSCSKDERWTLKGDELQIADVTCVLS
jgi:hypothetical protein